MSDLPSRRRVLRRPVPVVDLGPQVPPLLQRLYGARGVTTPQQLDYALRALTPPSELAGIDKAATLLAEAVIHDRSILVLGDFDADGATSTAVALLGLRMLGAREVGFRVPSRFADGYGLTPGIVERLQVEGAVPDVLVTVDNGISAHEGVLAAKALGMTVIVTDHHLAGAVLPPADAIVNPNQPGCRFPSKVVAGVGVIFYVLTAVRRVLDAQGIWGAQGAPNLASLLDLVALGTVADVVPLDHNNRVLVEQGVRRIRQGHARPGILALLEVAGRDPASIGATDLGFVLGPRLNAAGRLDDMSLGIACLLSDDPVHARTLAQELDRLNRERRSIETDMKAQALALLADKALNAAGLPWGVCLFEEEWHQGVIGILAARIREQVHRPVIAFALGDEDGETIKGSARINIRNHIADMQPGDGTRRPGMIRQFGGHAMAAGLTLARADLACFSDAFDQRVRELLSADALDATLLTDGELACHELTLDNARLLRRAGPWGQHFPEPLFDGAFRVLQARVVGERHLKMVVQAVGEGEPVDAIAFQWGGLAPGLAERQVRLVYRPDVNSFRGRETLQLLVEQVDIL